jgi:hypothetical protein
LEDGPHDVPIDGTLDLDAFARAERWRERPER